MSQAEHHIRDVYPGRFFHRVSPMTMQTPSRVQRRTSYHVAPEEASQVMHSEQPQATPCFVAAQVLPVMLKSGGFPQVGTDAFARTPRASASRRNGAYRALRIGDFIEEGSIQQVRGQGQLHARFTHRSRSSRHDLRSVAGFRRETKTMLPTLYIPQVEMTMNNRRADRLL